MCAGYMKFYTILYKGLVHLQILVSLGALKPICYRYYGVTVSYKELHFIDFSTGALLKILGEAYET